MFAAIRRRYGKYNDVNDYHGIKRAMPFAVIAALVTMVAWLALWEKPGSLFISLAAALQVGAHTSYYISRKRVYKYGKGQTYLQELMRLLYISMAAPTIIYVAICIKQQRYLNIEEMIFAAAAVISLFVLHLLQVWDAKAKYKRKAEG